MAHASLPLPVAASHRCSPRGETQSTGRDATQGVHPRTRAAKAPDHPPTGRPDRANPDTWRPEAQRL
eukprot:1393952-Alexandrium_andersonii.AAC.1